MKPLRITAGIIESTRCLSHTGWLWFTLEMFSNQPDLRYGLVCGNERQFDYFSMKDMNPLILAAEHLYIPFLSGFFFLPEFKG